MLNMEFLKDKVVEADDLVSMIQAQVDEEDEAEVNLADRIISLIFSHAKPIKKDWYNCLEEEKLISSSLKAIYH